MAAFESGLSDTSGTCLLPASRLSPPRRFSTPRSGAEVFPRHLARSGIEGGAASAAAALDSSRPTGCAPAAAGRAATAAVRSEDGLSRSLPVRSCSRPSGIARRPRLPSGGNQTVRRGNRHHRCTGHSRAGCRLTSIPVARCARRRRQPRQVVALFQTDGRARSPAPALGGRKGGLHLRRRGQTQIAAVQHRPHPAMAPAQPHGLDAPLRGGVGEAQLPHRVVEQARKPALQRQAAAVDLVEMVQDVHFEAALIAREAPGLVEELLITECAEGSSAGRGSQ